MIGGAAEIVIAVPFGLPSCQTIWLPICFPSMNELLDARGRQWQAAGGRDNGYAQVKRRLQGDVCLLAARMHRIVSPYCIAYEFHRATRRGDPSGIRAGAEKIILDALAMPRKGARGWPSAGIVHCDGFHCLRGDRVGWVFAGDASYRGEGVLVTIEESAAP